MVVCVCMVVCVHVCMVVCNVNDMYHIHVCVCMCVQVYISCAYWLVNRTGIPLVFKQEGTNAEAAGQSEEHERACSSTPLLFAYQEGEYIEK